LLFLSNKAEHANETKEHLQKYGDVAKVDWIQCDLNDLTQVKSVAEEIRNQHPDIDVAVFNAGIGVGKFELSKDGYDTHFQTNVLSQFLMLKILLPNLKKRAETTGDARVVFQSSSMHDTAVDKVKFASIDEINTDVGATALYGRTKLALILIARKLNRDLRAAGVRNLFVNASHPGLVGTDQQGQAVDAYGTAVGVLNTVLRPIMKDPIDAGYENSSP
jgi:WW domain-containing oxidoreductase